MTRPTDDRPPPPDSGEDFRLETGTSYSLVGRVETARGLYYWVAFIHGALGLTVLIHPESLGALLPGLELSRWWGLLGLFVAGLLVGTGRRLTQIELPEDFEARRRRAVDESDWPKVYEWTRLKADYCRQHGDVEGEIEARERLVEVAIEHLEGGEFQALNQLRRLERLASDPDAITERIAELLRDLEGGESLADVLERRLEEVDSLEIDEERELRRELVDLYGRLDHLEPEVRRRALAHFEWLLEHNSSEELIDDIVELARAIECGDEAADVLERAGRTDAVTRLEATEPHST